MAGAAIGRVNALPEGIFSPCRLGAHLRPLVLRILRGRQHRDLAEHIVVADPTVLVARHTELAKLVESSAKRGDLTRDQLDVDTGILKLIAVQHVLAGHEKGDLCPLRQDDLCRVEAKRLGYHRHLEPVRAHGPHPRVLKQLVAGQLFRASTTAALGDMAPFNRQRVGDQQDKEESQQAREREPAALPLGDGFMPVLIHTLAPDQVEDKSPQPDR